MRRSKIMYLFIALIGISFMVVSSNKLAQAGPPLKEGNPGVPGLLAKIAQLEQTVANQEATIQGLQAQVNELQALLDGMQNYARLVQTGQKISYYDGDDGDLQMGVAWPDPRFTDNGDGTVQDNLTGLIWLRDANCFGLRTWTEALDDCNGLQHGICGLTDQSVAGDWRLPNIRELGSLLDFVSEGPTFPFGPPFINGGRHYWTSTSYGDNTGGAGQAWFMEYNGVTDATLTYVPWSIMPVRNVK